MVIRFSRFRSLFLLKRNVYNVDAIISEIEIETREREIKRARVRHSKKREQSEGEKK